MLNDIDKLDVYVLMDNLSDPFTTSHPGMRWNELEYRLGVCGKKDLCGADLCRACTGLSLLIKLYHGDQIFTVLFDTGPDDGLVINNAKRMGLDLNTVDAIVLSHGHFDHYGGIISVLDAINKKDLPVYVHPQLLAARAYKTDDDEMVTVSYVLDKEKLLAHGARVIESDSVLTLFDDRLLISGEVPRKTHYETGLPGEYRYCDGSWAPNPEVIDERCLVMKLKNKGLCVFTGCGHTGVVNATQHAMSLVNDGTPVHLIMGGFHLAESSCHDRIPATIDDLQKIQPDFIVTGHCTGREAQAALTQTFADQHIPYGVGTVFNF